MYCHCNCCATNKKKTWGNSDHFLQINALNENFILRFCCLYCMKETISLKLTTNQTANFVVVYFFTELHYYKSGIILKIYLSGSQPVCCGKLAVVTFFFFNVKLIFSCPKMFCSSME